MADPSKSASRESFMTEPSHATTGEPETALYLSVVAAAPLADQLKPVSPLSLYRYATCRQKIFLSCAFLCAIGQFSINPLMSLFTKALRQGIFYANDDGTIPPTEGPRSKRDDLVLHNFIVFLILGACAFVLTAFAQILFARVADFISMRMRRKFFDYFLSKHVGWYDTHSSAEMATRLTNYIFSMVVISPCGFCIAFYTDWRLTLLMLLVIPFVVFALAFAMKAMTKSAAAQQEVLEP